MIWIYNIFLHVLKISGQFHHIGSHFCVLDLGLVDLQHQIWVDQLLQNQADQSHQILLIQNKE